MDELTPQPSPQPQPPETPGTPATPTKSRWPFVVAAIFTLLPGVLSLTGNSSAAAAGSLLIAPLGALVSGIVLGIRVGRTSGMRFLLSGVLGVACLVAAECIAFGGCAISNPKFNFH